MPSLFQIQDSVHPSIQTGLHFKRAEILQNNLQHFQIAVRLASMSPDYLAIRVAFLQTMMKLDPKEKTTVVSTRRLPTWLSSAVRWVLG